MNTPSLRGCTIRRTLASPCRTLVGACGLMLTLGALNIWNPSTTRLARQAQVENVYIKGEVLSVLPNGVLANPGGAVHGLKLNPMLAETPSASCLYWAAGNGHRRVNSAPMRICA